MDLGVPGPPDGHVVALDAATGAKQWDIRTSGYPVLAAYDASRDRLAVVEEQDPSIRLSYSVDALDPADGHQVSSSTRNGSLPTTLAIADLSGATGWVVGSVDTTPALVRPPSDPFTQGRISMIDPEAAASCGQNSSPLASPGPRPSRVRWRRSRRAAAR